MFAAVITDGDHSLAERKNLVWQLGDQLYGEVACPVFEAKKNRLLSPEGWFGASHNR